MFRFAYFGRPVYQRALVHFDQRSDSNTKLVAPRITFLNLNIRWESRVFDRFLLFSGLCFGFPAGVLFPVPTVLREEGLTVDILSWDAFNLTAVESSHLNC